MQVKQCNFSLNYYVVGNVQYVYYCFFMGMIDSGLRDKKEIGIGVYKCYNVYYGDGEK